MADKKISALTGATTPLAGSEVLFDGNATTGKIAGANWSSNVKYFFGATYLLA
jgi:hypothetical protein